jgi:hypothetical protein
MTGEAPAIFVALEQSGLGQAIRQSVWIYPVANVGHIVSLVVFAGSVAVMDVRLLGGLSATVPGQVVAKARRFAVAAFIAMVLTGFILFTAEASHVAMNPVFQIKVVLIGAALLNFVTFELGAKRAVLGLPPGAAMPPRAKFAAALSLGLWIAVATCGRSIAYF